MVGGLWPSGGGPSFFLHVIYRAVDVRRRWSCACLLVRFWRCVAPDHALCFVSVLRAYSLQASCGVTGVVVASGGSLWRRRAGSRSENSRRASGALAASTFDFFFVVGRDWRPPREQPFECSGSLWGASGRETHGVAGV